MKSQVVFKQLASPGPDSIREAIGDIIDRLGLSSELVGKRSLLKINAMSDEVFPGRNTSPWVLDGVLSELQSRFPGTEFLIVDADVAGSRQFDRACEQWGYRAIAKRRDVRILNLSESPVVTVTDREPLLSLDGIPGNRAQGRLDHQSSGAEDARLDRHQLCSQEPLGLTPAATLSVPSVCS